MPVAIRRPSAVSTSASRDHRAPAARGRFGPPGAAASSSSVFHSPQPGQRPSHLGAWCPQAVQTYATRVRVTDVPFWQ